MSYTTNNPERDRLLRDAIRTVIAQGKTPTMEHVSRALPEDFALEIAERDGTLNDMRAQPCGEVDPVYVNSLEAAPPESLDKIALLAAIADETPHQDVADEPAGREITEAEARHVLNNANKRLDKARAEMVIESERLKHLRGDLAQAIYQWTLLFQPAVQTREQLMRDVIASNQQLKQDIKDGKVPPRQMPRRGKSYIDQSNGRGGDGNDFARRYTGTTAGLPAGAQVMKGYRRNAMPSQYQGRQIKPPSDR